GAPRTALQGIVADLRGGIQRRLDVAGFEAPALLVLRAGRPDTREAVRLELEPYAQSVRLGLITAPTLLVDAAEYAEQVLDVMADLVSDHIGVRELPRRAELSGHHIEK